MRELTIERNTRNAILSHTFQTVDNHSPRSRIVWSILKTYIHIYDTYILSLRSETKILTTYPLCASAVARQIIWRKSACNFATRNIFTSLRISGRSGSIAVYVEILKSRLTQSLSSRISASLPLIAERRSDRAAALAGVFRGNEIKMTTKCALPNR